MFHNQREGPLTQSLVVGGFLPLTKKAKEIDWPEIQIHIFASLTGDFADFKPLFNFGDGYWKYLVKEMKGKVGMTVMCCVLRPRSR